MNMESFPRWMQPAPDSIGGLAIRRGKSAKTEAIHLLWSVWLFITPLFQPQGYTWTWVWLTLLTFPIFLALYGLAVVAPRRLAWCYAAGMILMSAVLLRYYPSGINYFVFGCVMLRTRTETSLWRYLLMLQSINFAFVSLAHWIGFPWQALVWIPALTTVIGLIVFVERRESHKDAELALSHSEVRRLAATAERERIGRDLHDLLGHTLSLITLKLELSRKLFDRDPATARTELEEAERVARHALAEVRSAVTGIRAADIAAELASARLLLASSDVALDYGAAPTDLQRDTERALSLVLREAVTNVSRHARADCVRVAFDSTDQGLLMTIEDDGRGGVRDAGNGLRGMRERVAALGGTLEIDSPPGRGTRLLVCLPAAMPSNGKRNEEAVAAAEHDGDAAVDRSAEASAAGAGHRGIA